MSDRRIHLVPKDNEGLPLSSKDFELTVSFGNKTIEQVVEDIVDDRVEAQKLLLSITLWSIVRSTMGEKVSGNTMRLIQLLREIVNDVHPNETQSEKALRLLKEENKNKKNEIKFQSKLLRA